MFNRKTFKAIESEDNSLFDKIKDSEKDFTKFLYSHATLSNLKASVKIEKQKF